MYMRINGERPGIPARRFALSLLVSLPPLSPAAALSSGDFL
jgi:hypothetical protein